jgi:hypothetical protein
MSQSSLLPYLNKKANNHITAKSSIGVKEQP